MRLLGRILGITITLVVALLIGAAYWLQDANRLKPELETLIAENSEYTVHINGDISWVLFPPLHLQMRDLNFQREDEDINVASLELKMDLSAMWEDISRWQVTEMHLADTMLVQEDTTTTVNQLDLYNFRPNEPAEFNLDASYSAAANEPPFAATAQGVIVYSPATDSAGPRISLGDTAFVTDLAKGVCEADIAELSIAAAEIPQETDEDLLPLETLLTYNIGADCTLSELTIGTETFLDSTIEITNVDGLMNVLLNVEDFLGGSLVADVDIDATQQPVQWNVLPEMTNVDSQRLLNWTDGRMQWIAPIAFNSSLKMSGNTEVDLASSIHAQSEFDGGQGQLNIAKIKRQLMQIALATGQTGRVAEWPDVWNYENFTGRWNIAGVKHDLSFVLDNMNVDANGDYDYAADTIDMLAQVTINEAPEASPFQINPLLQGTPIPVRCRGPAADPKCRLDQDATKNLLAQTLQSDSNSELRQKLDEKIDEEVPEEYRETARGLLDLLGRSLEKSE